MTFLSTLVLLLLLAAPDAAIGAVAAERPPPLPPGVELAAVLTDARLPEISGLAWSRRHPGILWVHNDGPDKGSSDPYNTIHAMDRGGQIRASLHLPLRNIDWEDMAAFEHAGRAYLLLADTGDNGGLRKELSLHVIEEPDKLEDGTLSSSAVRTIRFRWPDGPRDCEAVAVDAAAGAIYLVSKKRVPPELFHLSLHPTEPKRVQVARRLGTLAGILQPGEVDLARSPLFGKYRSQISAADLSADGRRFAVISYRHVYWWSAHPAGWGAALAQLPQRLELPWMAQAEALGFEPDGSALWIGSERLPAPLIRLPLPSHRSSEAR